jgi:hypothetical protein
MWGSLAWFLWGMSFPVGKWLQIESLKPQKDSGMLWFGFGGLITVCIVVLNCTEVILARIDERSEALEHDNTPQSTSVA